MKQQVQVYFTELNPDAVINLDQPCHYSEFQNLPVSKYQDVNNEYIEFMEHNIGYWSNLVEHIGRWGILYPIVVNTGVPKIRPFGLIPKEKRCIDSKYWMVCEHIGGLRLLAAQTLGIKIPALVNDHVGLFKNQKPLTIKELSGICVGIDEVQISASFGVHIPHCPRVHIEIEEGTYAEYRSAAITTIMANHPEMHK